MIIPRPQRLSTDDGALTLSAASSIGTAAATREAAQWLATRLRSATGLPLDLRDDSERDDAQLVFTHAAALGPAAYELTITPDRVQIIAGDDAGALYAAQSLLQLLPADVHRSAPVAGTAWTLPCVRIADSPRYAWRGMMLDVVRHFLPKREILRMLDLLAMHKLNVLHLHLTDDQGWRIEIPRYPRLTSVGSWRAGTQIGKGANTRLDRRPHGGFYTQDDLREIVAYARALHITVVPEVDCPGHVRAAVAAYPELGLGTEPVEVSTTWGISDMLLNLEDATLDFFRHALDDVMDIFPSTSIGIGADECLPDPWASDSRTVERMAQLGIDDATGIHPWFVRHMETHVAQRGRRLFAWDEVLDGPPTRRDTIIAAWRGRHAIARSIAAGHDVVSCPDDEAYLDYHQSDHPAEPIPVGTLLDLERAYRFTPGTAEEGAPSPHVLGGQANLWTEYVPDARMVDYYTFPRMLAFAEALWTGDADDYPEFLVRVQQHLPRLDAIGVEYRPLDGPRPWQSRPDAEGARLTRDQRAAVMDRLLSGERPEYAEPPTFD